MKKIPLPLVLILLALIVLTVGPMMPLGLKQFSLFFSLLLKDVLMVVLPFIIFIYLFSCLLSFEGNVFTFVLALVAGVCFSNFLSTMIAYGLAQGGLSNFSCTLLKGDHILTPLWSLTLTPPIKNDHALFAGFLSGIVFSLYPHPLAQKLSAKGKAIASLFLDRIFIPLIPLFILGFLFKMQEEGILLQLVKAYFPIFLMLVGTYVTYLGFLYGSASGFHLKKTATFIRNALPAGMTGFSAMSSAAAMPLTLKAAEKNTSNPSLVRAIIPATVNIHLVGDSIGVPILAMGILLTFGYPLPDFQSFLVFSGYFVLAKFAVAAVPGGGVIVMLPVLKNTLGFTDPMLALMTALYLLFDPLFTSVNVMGNGAFSLLFSKLFGGKKGKATESPSAA